MKFEYIKGATPIDANEAEDLIPNLTTQKELNEWEQKNISNAAIKYYGKKYFYNDILNVCFLKAVHKDMFSNTWKWAGKFRNTMKNIGVEPIKIYIELKNLLDDVLFCIKYKTYDEDGICVRFHRRLVGIHLFPNGNGRHARFVTDLLTESMKIEPFTWGSKDLYNAGETRSAYIAALIEADKDNYEPLLRFVRS